MRVSYVALYRLSCYILLVACVALYTYYTLCIHLYMMVDLDISDADKDRRTGLLDYTSLDEVDNLIGERGNFFVNLATVLKCSKSELQIANKYKKQNVTKDMLASFLATACKLLDDQARMIDNFRELRSLEQPEIISSQRSVIKLQAELLQCKEDQLKSLKTTVQTTVHETVQEEIRSYSAAVKKIPSPVMSNGNLKKAVKDAIVDDDRSKNIIVFGLDEEDGECLQERITDVLQELGEKPRADATRFGRMDKDREGKFMPRPVKVTVANSTSARQILLKSKNLRMVQRFKSVYLSPDRSSEERATQKKLVSELKKLIKEQPGLYHYIRGGTVCSTAKSAV